jgi:hypothetical protein
VADARNPRRDVVREPSVASRWTRRSGTLIADPP